MRWSDEVTLIHAKNEVNENGFDNLVEAGGGRTTVYANRKSVGFNEFFAAQRAGFNEEMKLDIYTAEYDGQPLAEYNGKRYAILRTYIDPKTNGEFTELTLIDAMKRGL